MPTRVIVIGAGIAGMSAALAFIERGVAVTVLEAQSRAGGRVRTVREPLLDGAHAEAGGRYILGGHVRTRRLAESLGVLLEPLTGERRLRWRVWLRGARSNDVTLPVRELQVKYLDSLMTEHTQVLEALSVMEAPTAQTTKLDATSLTELLRSRRASGDDIRVLCVGPNETLGEGSDAVSALSLLHRNFLFRRHAESGAFVVHGGTDRLTTAMSEKLGRNLLLECTVLEIGQSRREAWVRARTGGNIRSFHAEHVVCAIPFALLREINISPPLGNRKSRVVRALNLTSVTRTYIQYDMPSGLFSEPGSITYSDFPMMHIYDVSNESGSRHRLLETYATGARARRLADVDARQRHEAVARWLDEVYPGSSRHVIAGTSVSWDEDPWARGAFACFRPGQFTHFVRDGARAEGRLHFAGDQTSHQPGWMEGALESAERVVQEIVDRT